MLSIASIFFSVLLASASPARREICSLDFQGKNISITNGQFEAGFSSNGLTLVSRPISTAVSEFTAQLAISPSFGEFKLFNATEGLFLTNTGAALPEMLPIGSPISGAQNWVFNCSSCTTEGSPGNMLIGEGCFVTSLFDGRCLNISDAAPLGSPVTLGDCQAIGQSINIYTA
ncbi:hypothetical protein MVEN_00135400 [Mycena venus]|uniref:Uncharacterized protein n=1 Tax=Mycena venus TaxID=2733690 RepID=A0A8H6Z0I4_9AGAR|nr:hypothetical protein MVEN_00135400 [Mycena venus]